MLKKVIKVEKSDEVPENGESLPMPAKDVIQKDNTKNGIIKEESLKDGQNVDYGVILDYFGFADKRFGGRFSFLVIIALHILINIATCSMSFYLAFALSDFSN